MADDHDSSTGMTAILIGAAVALLLLLLVGGAVYWQLRNRPRRIGFASVGGTTVVAMRGATPVATFTVATGTLKLTPEQVAELDRLEEEARAEEEAEAEREGK
ncbi:hypothetical protein ACFL59_01275 [Planctomycetota bacterium]